MNNTDMLLPSDFPTDAALFAHLENEEKCKEAYVLYVGKEMKPSDIALEIAVPVATIRQWIIRRQWRKRVLEARDQRAEEERIALELFRDDNRLEEVKAQMAAGKKGREIVAQMLEERGADMTPAMLKQLGEALRSFSDVAARAVGLGETVETKDAGRDEGVAGKIRPPAVVIVAGPGSQVQVKEGV